MRKYIVATLLFFLSLNTSFSQKLVENKIDEFTKHAVKRTSWETLMEKFGMVIYLRVSVIDSTEYIDVKSMLGGKVFAIPKGETFMIKLANDSIVKLNTLSHEVSCRGCGAKGFSGSATEGIQVAYVIDKQTHDLLKQYPIKKVRLYTTEGYHEEDVNKNKSDALQSILKLIE